MVLWNFDLLWKNYDTMEKTMVLWTKQWYYGTIPRTIELRFTKVKHGRLPKTKKLWFIKEKIMAIHQKIEVCWQILSSRTLIYYGKTMGKSMVLWKKTIVLWKKNYGTLPKTIELWFTMENMVQWKKTTAL